MDVNNLNEIVESKYEITSRTAFPKSDGYDRFSYSNGLVFYLSDLHIESHMKSLADEKELIGIVDRLINNTKLLYAALRFCEIKRVEDMLWELKKIN